MSASGGLPRIQIAPPGPKAQALMERDRRVLSSSYTRPYPFVMDHGDGAIAVDADGNRFLDFAAGIAVCATGHSHPDVVEAIREQSGRYLHMAVPNFYQEPLVAVAERLAAHCPVGDSPADVRVLFTNSGTEAIEAALKLARYKTRRHLALAFFGGFHGRSMGALSLTASKTLQRHGFGPMLPGAVHVPYADCYRCPFGRTPDACDLECVDYIEEFPLKRIAPPDEIAALVVEPIQGEGGYVVPPARWFARLRALCNRHGILMIADEVQSGIGRTGKMFAMEHMKVKPDIVAVAKGIASGLPLGACIARADVMDWPAGAHASTFGGNPVACAAALATLRLVEGSLMDNARLQGERLLSRLKALADKHPLVGEARGLGLMVGLELVTDRASRQRAPEQTKQVIQECFKRGLLVLACGENTIRFCPPLIVDTAQVDAAVAIVDAALGAVAPAA